MKSILYSSISILKSLELGVVVLFLNLYFNSLKSIKVILSLSTTNGYLIV